MQDMAAILEKKENVRTAAERKRAEDWDWAVALVKMAGMSPTSDFLTLVEQRKRGEITTKDMENYLNMKYKVKGCA